MIKKKNNLKILQETIKNNGHLIDKSKLKRSIFKNNLNLNTDINCVEYFQPDIISNNNALINSKVKVKKDTLYKTTKYTLYPTTEQKQVLINYCYGYTDMYNSFVKLIKNKRKEIMEDRNISNLRYVDMKYKPNLKQIKKDLKFVFVLVAKECKIECLKHFSLSESLQRVTLLSKPERKIRSADSLLLIFQSFRPGMPAKEFWKSRLSIKVFH